MLQFICLLYLYVFAYKHRIIYLLTFFSLLFDHGSWYLSNKEWHLPHYIRTHHLDGFDVSKCTYWIVNAYMGITEVFITHMQWTEKHISPHWLWIRSNKNNGKINAKVAIEKSNMQRQHRWWKRTSPLDSPSYNFVQRIPQVTQNMRNDRIKRPLHPFHIYNALQVLVLNPDPLRLADSPVLHLSGQHVGSPHEARTVIKPKIATLDSPLENKRS